MNEESPSSRFDLHKHPAIWTFAACLIIAVLHLWAMGQRQAVVVWSGALLGVLLFCWLTVQITEAPPDRVVR